MLTKIDEKVADILTTNLFAKQTQILGRRDNVGFESSTVRDAIRAHEQREVEKVIFGSTKDRPSDHVKRIMSDTKKLSRKELIKRLERFVVAEEYASDQRRNVEKAMLEARNDLDKIRSELRNERVRNVGLEERQKQANIALQQQVRAQAELVRLFG